MNRIGIGILTLAMACKPAGEEIDLDPDKDGFTEADGDCDNSNGAVYPGAPEICDGLANNCDAAIVESVVPVDFATLQEAVDARTEDTLICLEAGTYEEQVTVTGSAQIGSFEGGDVTTLSGTEDSPVIELALVDGEEVRLSGLRIASTANRWEHAIQVQGGTLRASDLIFDGLESVDYNPAALWAASASVSLSNVDFRNLDFDETGHAVRVSAAYSDDNGAPVLELNDVTFSDSDVAALATHFMTVNIRDVLVENVGFSRTYGPAPVFNILGGSLDIDGLTLLDTTGEVNLIGRASNNTVKNIHIEGGELNLVVMGLSKKEIKDELEYENQSMLVSFVEGLGNVDLTGLTMVDTVQKHSGMDFRGVTADQVFVHSTVLERSEAVLELQNSHASHVALLNNAKANSDESFREVVDMTSSSLENFMIAGVAAAPDNQYGMAIGCDSTAAYGIIYDIQTKSGYDGGGVTHQCSKASRRALLSHVAILNTSPYGITYNDWTGHTYPNLEHVTIAQSGSADLYSEGNWPNYSSEELVRQAGSYASLKNYTKLPYDLFRLESDSSLVDLSVTAFDPDGSAADIGPFAGPKAGAWDLDGDGHPAHWMPGHEPTGEQDCNDFDPTVGPGDC